MKYLSKRSFLHDQHLFGVETLLEHRIESEALRATLTFQAVAEMGYTGLVPVIPPHAVISPTSKVSPASRGKVPGVRTSAGKWVGMLGWQEIQATPEDLRKWEKCGASIGLRCDAVVGIDVDITDESLALTAYRALAGQHGLPPNPAIRVGQRPKFLLPVVVTDGPVLSRVLAFHAGLDEHHIDILANGRQFVLHGVHPKTKGLYVWNRPAAGDLPATRGIPRAADLPRITKDQLDALLAGLTAALVAAGAVAGQSVVVGAPRAHVNQEELCGPQDVVTEALMAIPNTLVYEDWIRLGYALRAAAQDWNGRGRELWARWSATWTKSTDDTHTAGFAQEKWPTFRGPFVLGAEYIYDLAAKHGWSRGRTAQVEFESLRGLMPPPAPAPVPPSPAVAFQPPGVLPVNVQGLAELAQWSDAAIASRFADAAATRLIFVPERGIWHHFNGVCWSPDPSRLTAEQYGHDFLEREARRVSGPDPEREAKLRTRLLSAEMLQKVERLSRKFRIVPQSRLDADLWALNTPGGVFDLRTGQLATGSTAPFTRATKCAPAGAESAAPGFRRFLAEICGGDAALVDYLILACGLTLWGSPIEPLMFFLYGSGGNGKSVLTGILSGILGDLAVVADETVFLQQRSDQHPTSRASLAGARMVLVPELPEGARWNESMLKRFSAGEPVKARFIGRDEFTYVPQGTLWFTANSKPGLHKVDPAIVRRLRLITFDFVPPKPDPWLMSRILDTEGPAILRLMIEAAARVYAEGMVTAPAVAASTGDYFADSDPVMAFIRDCCIVGPGERESIKALHARYEIWRQEHVMDYVGADLTAVAFSRRLAAAAPVTRSRDRSDRYLVGVRLAVRGVPGPASRAPAGLDEQAF